MKKLLALALGLAVWCAGFASAVEVVERPRPYDGLVKLEAEKSPPLNGVPIFVRMPNGRIIILWGRVPLKA